MQSTTAHLASLRFSLILSSNLRVRLQVVTSLHSLWIKFCMYFSFPPTCSVNLIFLDLITITIHDEWYELWSSSLCNSLFPHVASCLFSTAVGIWEQKLVMLSEHVDSVTSVGLWRNSSMARIPKLCSAGHCGRMAHRFLCVWLRRGVPGSSIGHVTSQHCCDIFVVVFRVKFYDNTLK
jgi:hypothetical protein